jgi:hypothetical protein
MLSCLLPYLYTTLFSSTLQQYTNSTLLHVAVLIEVLRQHYSHALFGLQGSLFWAWQLRWPSAANAIVETVVCYGPASLDMCLQVYYHLYHYTTGSWTCASSWVHTHLQWNHTHPLAQYRNRQLRDRCLPRPASLEMCTPVSSHPSTVISHHYRQLRDCCLPRPDSLEMCTQVSSHPSTVISHHYRQLRDCCLPRPASLEMCTQVSSHPSTVISHPYFLVQ